MRGRLSSTIWAVAGASLAALLAVLVLAYTAGAGGGGLPIWDFAALPGNAGVALLIAVVIALVTSGVLLVMLGNRILKPVEELLGFATRLAEGDHRTRLELETDNEFGALAGQLNRVAERMGQAALNQQAQESLQRSVAEFLAVTNQIARGDLTLRGRVSNDGLGAVVDSVNYMLDNFTRVLERVRKAAVDVSGSANGILVAAEQIAHGATQQDEEIASTSSAVEELTISMKQVSNNAESSAEAARRALHAAEQGNRAVRDTLEGMQRIRASVQAGGKKIKTLGDRSLEISEILNLITDISEQTNLLALNAAIEAARAGEAGRGFGVVADEIRKLAEHSRSATKEIASLIKAIQAETNEAVIVMEEGTREVEVGAGLADQAGQALEAISTVVRQSADLVEEISLASKQQVRGIEGVAHAMQVISRITRQTAQGARQTTGTVEQMVKLSEQLNEALSQFRVASSAPPPAAPVRAEGAKAGRS